MADLNFMGFHQLPGPNFEDYSFPCGTQTLIPFFHLVLLVLRKKVKLRKQIEGGLLQPPCADEGKEN